MSSDNAIRFPSFDAVAEARLAAARPDLVAHERMIVRADYGGDFAARRDALHGAWYGADGGPGQARLLVARHLARVQAGAHRPFTIAA